MKQHITPSQLKEIPIKISSVIFGGTYENRKNYYAYNAKKMTIGKMIEILKNKYGDQWCEKVFFATRDGDVFENGDCLCDALWEAVKYVLESEGE